MGPSTAGGSMRDPSAAGGSVRDLPAAGGGVREPSAAGGGEMMGRQSEASEGRPFSRKPEVDEGGL